jgi:hypothetical protein
MAYHDKLQHLIDARIVTRMFFSQELHQLVNKSNASNARLTSQGMTLVSSLSKSFSSIEISKSERGS